MRNGWRASTLAVGALVAALAVAPAMAQLAPEGRDTLNLLSFTNERLTPTRDIAGLESSEAAA